MNFRQEDLLAEIELLKTQLENLKAENDKLKFQVADFRNRKSLNDILFDLTLDYIVVKNAATQYWKHVNPALVQALGYTEQELTTRPFMNFLHPEDRDETMRVAQKVHASGSVQNFENRYLTRDGRILWLSWTAVYHSKDNLVYAVARDVTSIKERELAIAQQKLELASASRLNAIGRLAASIAHEINNPLTIVNTQAYMLRQLVRNQSLNQEELLKISEQMEHMSSRIVRIINGLRAFTRESVGDALEKASLKKIIEDTLIFCQSNYRAQGINLDIDPVPEDLVIQARPVQITQVLLNLFNNAYDASVESPQKVIRLSVKVIDSSIQIRISNSGAGIPAELRPQLFKAFFTTKPIGKGTGLGLNIAKTILTSHGGDIYLDESVKDTTFVVTLPKVPV